MKKFFFELDRSGWVTRCSFLRWLRIWYLFCTIFRFWHWKPGFKLLKNRILDFLIKKVFQKKSRNIPFDAEFHSLQDGLFSFNFRGYEQFVDSYTVSNLLRLLWASMSMYRSRYCVERLVIEKRLILIKIKSFWPY